MKTQLEQEIIEGANGVLTRFLVNGYTLDAINAARRLLNKISQLEQIMENRVRDGDGKVEEG